jgi:galactose mutarotase-like enzyme
VDGKSYVLAINNGPNALHGGLEGFDKKNWSASAVIQEDRAGVVFLYSSPDGEEGYPGKVQVRYMTNKHICTEYRLLRVLRLKLYLQYMLISDLPFCFTN